MASGVRTTLICSQAACEVKDKMEKQWDVLMVSARPKNKRALLQILQGLPINVFTASTVQQAYEVLSSHSIRLIFSEENFPDGSYRDLLAAVHSGQTKTPLVLLLSTGEWDECLEAMGLGATEVLRCPLQATDVELTLIRVARDQKGQTDRPLQKGPTYPLASRLAVSSTAN
jgi:DNA-binding NtrC family response regulator